MATCESLTGGLICAELTSVPGSSQVVRGGLVTYATATKTSIAGVDPVLIETHGVVSAEVAQAMAEGARKNCGADWAVAVTGVAGPGALDSIPAGTVWLAVVNSNQSWCTLLKEEGSRDQVRHQVVEKALSFLNQILIHSSGGPNEKR